MLVHQLSVLVVILNAMRLLRVPKDARAKAVEAKAKPVAA
jgi:Cd2+/Zn2+-exporting ATPase